ncbi:hypothetical protein EVAR_47526_1 [Eumeta japonica]|uniref:Uncharacterized protein n=1 Tax=Eumeta variegata TaxID=151549 RepID=A0A4C1XQ18_EUMVA|nr:hypothetical protein EVAR_47526_1 [Eumeta japonica]
MTCTVLSTDLCRSELPSNDEISKYNARGRPVFFPLAFILRKCDVPVTTFTAVKVCALYCSSDGGVVKGWNFHHEPILTSEFLLSEIEPLASYVSENVKLSVLALINVLIPTIASSLRPALD